MAVNEYIIEQTLEVFNHKATVKPFIVEVSSPYYSFRVNNDIILLSNKTLDIPITAKMVISSDNNVLITSKSEFENWEENRNQGFSNNIFVKTTNYGATFVPYQLSFMRVAPLPNNKCEQKPTQKDCKK